MSATTDGSFPAGGVRLTILVDNRAAAGLEPEHGLALWLEAGDRRILFDTGAGRALESNARLLGIDLALADTLVLSHGHYDHTGGVAAFLRRARKARVYCHPAVLRRRYSIRDGKAKPVHAPARAVAALNALPRKRIRWVCRPVSLSEGIGLTGNIPRVNDFEDPGGPFYLDRPGRRADPIEDDLALWVRTDQGLVVLVGCAHAGLVNTLEHAECLAGADRKIRAVIGGFHLGSAGPERLALTLAALRRLDPGVVAPCHCTGESASAFLRDGLGARVLPGSAGRAYQF